MLYRYTKIGFLKHLLIDGQVQNLTSKIYKVDYRHGVSDIEELFLLIQEITSSLTFLITKWKRCTMSDLVMACEGGSNSPSDAMCRCRITPYQHPSYPEETSSELRQAVSEINLMLLLFDMPPRAPIVATVSEKLKSPLVRPELRFFSCDFTIVSTTRWEERAPWFVLLAQGCCWPGKLSLSQPTSSCPFTFPVLSPSPPGVVVVGSKQLGGADLLCTLKSMNFATLLRKQQL